MSVTLTVNNGKRPYGVFLPEFLGVPKFFAEKIYGKNDGYTIWDKWFDFNELSKKIDEIMNEWWELEKNGKARAGDLHRFKARFFAVVVPFFDQIDLTYAEKKKTAQSAAESEMAGLLWQAHFFALHFTLEYAEFFFWRESKFKNLPTSIKIGYKPSCKAEDWVF